MAYVTVVIPCYNHGRFLREAIGSVLQYKPAAHFTFIIVNDGSTEPDTLRVLDELASEGYRVIHQPNKGLGAARNAGVRAAVTPYILPLDCDNRIRPVYITRGVQVLEHHPEVGVVYGQVQLFGRRNEVQHVPAFDLGALLRSNYIDACAIFRKSAWEQVGGYDEKMPVMGYEDWDFWLSLASAGYGFYRLEEVGFEYQVRDDSMLRTNGTYDKQRQIYAYTLKKHAALFNDGLLAEIYLERAWLSFELEAVKAKLAAARRDRSTMLTDNRELGKRLLKNIFRPLLKRVGLK